MSIASDSKVRELERRVLALERRLLEAPAVYIQPVAPVLDVVSLSAEYEKKFGRPPHHRMLPETIKEALGRT